VAARGGPSAAACSRAARPGAAGPRLGAPAAARAGSRAALAAAAARSCSPGALAGAAAATLAAHVAGAGVVAGGAAALVRGAGEARGAGLAGGADVLLDKAAALERAIGQARAPGFTVRIGGTGLAAIAEAAGAVRAGYAGATRIADVVRGGVPRFHILALATAPYRLDRKHSRRQKNAGTDNRIHRVTFLEAPERVNEVETVGGVNLLSWRPGEGWPGEAPSVPGCGLTELVTTAGWTLAC
jgi:hypothetical protein